MIVYWIIAILTVLINLYPIKTRRQYSIRLIVSLLPLFLYGAFRVDYGLDYVGYEDYFNAVKISGFVANERMELGFYFLNKILPNFRSLLIIQTIVLCTAYFFLFKWYIPSKWSWLGALLLFLSGPQTIFFMLSGVRNGIAISIFIFSSYLIYRRKIIPFAILVFFASFFHQSILIYGPIVYLIVNYTSFSKKTLIMWMFLMVFLTVSANTVVLNYVSLFVEEYFDRYNTYIESAMEKEQRAGWLITIFSFVATFLFLLNVKCMRFEVLNLKNCNNKVHQVEKNSNDIYGVLMKKRLLISSTIKQKYKNVLAKDRMITKMNMLFFISYLLGALNLRMTQYLMSFFIVGIVTVIWKSSNKFLKYVYLFLITMYLIYAFVLWILNPYFSYSNYESILF